MGIYQCQPFPKATSEGLWCFFSPDEKNFLNTECTGFIFHLPLSRSVTTVQSFGTNFYFYPSLTIFPTPLLHGQNCIPTIFQHQCERGKNRAFESGSLHNSLSYMYMCVVHTHSCLKPRNSKFYQILPKYKFSTYNFYDICQRCFVVGDMIPSVQLVGAKIKNYGFCCAPLLESNLVSLEKLIFDENPTRIVHKPPDIGHFRCDGIHPVGELYFYQYVCEKVQEK